MKSLHYFSRSLVSGPLAVAAVVLAALSTPLSAQTPSAQEEFREANDRLEQLVVANNQLRQRIARQEQLISEMTASIEHAALLADEENSPLNALIERMMVSMEQFVEADLPFEIELRRQAVARIRGLVDNPEAPLSQKMQMLIGLYQAEGAYGRTLDTYETTMEINGVETDVIITRVGRLLLAYQTADRRTTAMWDNDSDQWVELDPGNYRTSLYRAMSVASSRITPELIHIPVPAPVAAQ
jgi:signal transduction histidine kinase